MPKTRGSPRLLGREALEKLDDAALVERCRNGEERAWEVLVRRYRRLVYAVPSRAGLREEEVEEVFHTTFSRLAERIDSVRDAARVRAWMVTTARRLTIDCMRSRRDSRQVDLPDETLETFADDAESAPEALERVERQHLVRQALLALGERCRSLLNALFYDSGGEPPSYDRISRDLGIPVGSIGPTRARCLEKLQKEFLRIRDE